MVQNTTNKLSNQGARAATELISACQFSKGNEKNLALVAHFFRTLYHVFPRFDAVLKQIPDPREEKKTKYSLPTLIKAGLILFLFDEVEALLQ